ncbi:MAG TPA: ribonuclease P [Patescibacteria group bacterium]|nr:ribonuclease P [Patescibacteria group bacterium]
MDASTRQIAKQRIQILFILAEQTIHENPNLAKRYVEKARKIAMSAKIRLPTEYRRQVCKHCKSFILPGTNCRVRLQQRREPHIVITCLKCGGKTRIPIKRKENRKHD